MDREFGAKLAEFTGCVGSDLPSSHHAVMSFRSELAESAGFVMIRTSVGGALKTIGFVLLQIWYPRAY
jgi:hypothetical protein